MRREGSVVTTVRVRLGAFAGGMLAWKHQRDEGSGNGTEPNSDDVLKVIRFYLKEKGSGGAGAGHPDPPPAGGPRGGGGAALPEWARAPRGGGRGRARDRGRALA